MNNLKVVDGDFVAQLCHHLDAATLSDSVFDLRVLQTNKYAVYKTHLDYLRAGANIIRTNTTRATASSFVKHLGIYGTEAASIITSSVELAQKAVFKYYEEMGGDSSNVEEFAKHRPLIAGFCASYLVAELDRDNHNPDGISFWKYVQQHDIIRCHRMRMQILLNAGVDLLALEGIPCEMEAKVLVDLVRNFRTARVWMTFLCANEAELLDGSNFLDIALYCYHSLPGQIVAIGAMCPEEDGITLLENVYMNTFEIDHFPKMMYFSFNKNENRNMSYMRELINFEVRYISGRPGSSAKDIKEIHDLIKQIYNSAGPSSTIPKICSLQNKKYKPKL